MQPVNTKSLFHRLTSTLEKLDNDEIDVFKATATAKLVGECGKLLNYELKRAALLSNPEIKAQHRLLESKNFDSIPQDAPKRLT
jgi:hypothetical protein|tara:strand:+ start:152 stop:403 length:252 start_codon:yes stop_codon:yes gene_type:complete